MQLSVSNVRVQLGLLLLMLVALPARSTTIWTDWTGAVAGPVGSATGTLGSVGVTYSGPLLGSVTNGTSGIWSPDSSFIGGTSTTSPSTVGDELQLNGLFGGTRTITFSTPVVNPLFAFWSLGNPLFFGQASFTFNQTPTLQAGGPNSIYGGSSVTVSGNTVSGFEGNGVVQFTGTFNSISWTNTFEHYYSFNVGMNEVPEPGSALLAFGGFAAIAVMVRLRRQ